MFVRRSWTPALLPATILAAALAIPPVTADGQRTVTIVQINDIYRIDGVKNGSSGGPGRIASLIDRTRRERPGPVYTLLAGDFLGPSLESGYFGGRQMIDALNFLHERAPLIVTVGNHEFDDRRPTLLTQAIGASRFGWIVSNAKLDLDDSSAARRLSRDTLVAVGGVRLGLFALTLIESARSWVTIDRDHERIAEERIAALEHAGADVIVGLTHLDMPDDMRIARLRARHPKFVWIAGGHEHFLQQAPLTDSTALITKGDANGRRVWRVTITTGGRRPTISAEQVALDESVPVDSIYRRTIQDRYHAELRAKIPFFDQQIGVASVPLDATEQTVRAAESNWGNFLTDVMRTAFPDVPADVAVLNSGTLRIDDEISGPIRWEHLARSFGFPARVGLVSLRGRDLRLTVLEQSVSADRPEGRFLQVSGVKFAFDRRQPVGQRVSDVQIQRGGAWEPLDDTRIYVVAVPEFLYGGGDGYHFKDRAIQVVPPGPDLKLIAFDAITSAFARGEGIGRPVEGRIVERR